MMINSFELYILILIWLTMIMIQHHVSVRKQNFNLQSSYEGFQSFWMEFGVLLRHVDLMNLILIVSCLSSSQEKEPYLVDSVKKIYHSLDLNWTFTDKFLLNML